MPDPDCAVVLIVEDDDAGRAGLGAALREAGFVVEFADSGEAALEALSQRAYDVIVSDLAMRSISGLDLLEEVKARHPKTKFILVTAFAEYGDVEAARNGGALACLEKPIDLERLEELMTQAVGSG